MEGTDGYHNSNWKWENQSLHWQYKLSQSPFGFIRRWTVMLLVALFNNVTLKFTVITSRSFGYAKGSYVIGSEIAIEMLFSWY